jgi:hypothetical protein
MYVQGFTCVRFTAYTAHMQLNATDLRKNPTRSSIAHCAASWSRSVRRHALRVDPQMIVESDLSLMAEFQQKCTVPVSIRRNRERGDRHRLDNGPVRPGHRGPCQRQSRRISDHAGSEYPAALHKRYLVSQGSQTALTISHITPSNQPASA